MAAALSSIVTNQNTKSAIMQALKSDLGKRTVWVIVEAEDDYNVYLTFMDSASTVVKTSEGTGGNCSYANVESIVTDIKTEVPLTHIFGIRDADYTKYEAAQHVFPANIFVTDRRDLEMMMLEVESVKQALTKWAPTYEVAFEKCVPICKHFGYLRIYNCLNDLDVSFHRHLNTGKYWDYKTHDLAANWEENSTGIFMALAGKACSPEEFREFVITHTLDTEDFYDICRGHDLLPLLSKALIREHIYSVDNLMLTMSKAYSIDDFKTTHLYANIKAWQEAEGVIALAA